MSWFFLIVVIFLIVVSLVIAAEEDKKSKMTPEELKNYEKLVQNMQDELKWGVLNEAMICPHCQTKGQIRTKPVDRKKGVSGTKAAGALLTGGISILATGLSRHEQNTQAHCDVCQNTWDF